MTDKIRICAIIPVREGLISWGDAHRTLLSSIASPDVEITLVDLPSAPIKAINGSYDTQLVGLLQVQEVIKAEQAGYDAVATGCLDEPGVSAAKDAVNIPVVGEAEAAMHFASMVGRRFSFLLPGEASGNMRGGHGGLPIEDLARKYGFISKLASIRSVSSGGSLDFADPEEGLPQATLEQASLAVEEDGADAVIGYGSLDIIGYLTEHLDVPVIDPIQSAAIMAETLARLDLAQSKRAVPKRMHLATAS
ncbi:MAG: aspartate/glutamate racemase family protein [Anaerolineales bacterium]